MENRGRIKIWKGDNNYGFIKRDDGGDIFFHKSGLMNPTYEPERGDRVRFKVVEGQRGPKAEEVEAI